ncbi:photosystem II protein Psb27 [Cyanobium sp. LEGE 06143]|jgi:photosystem II Psb27 protein|uniref:photosystem II protein Psb27 n=1 Tax=Cyanobium sp. LEGE 06143 TaxID=945727 RepID=UPI001882A775|nr:photosystem II protein Psb27 [Cyanobium sp. LEGE 06143]MBE9173682.1 photosystem II protein Psb27 [Cyanobium sp. LEGE 06143]
MAADLLSSLRRLLGRWSRSLLAGCLGLCLLLAGCSSADGLSGSYVDDTVAVADVLITTVGLEADDPSRAEAEQEARGLINEYMARYRPRNAVNGLSSFTTMQTALNSLAGHYANYPNRPLPEALRERVSKELLKAEKNVVRGA